MAPFRRILCLAAVISFLAGCSGDASAPVVASPVATGVAVPPTGLEVPSSSPGPLCPNGGGGSCQGSLPTGAHRSEAFQPSITYRVPAGWTNLEDTPGNFLLLPPGGDFLGVNTRTSDYIGIYSHVAAAAPCAEAPARGVGPSPMDIANWIAHQRALKSTPPRQVSIGGLEGVVLDITMAKGWPKPCPVYTAPSVPLITGLAPSSLNHGIIRGLAIRLYLLEHAGTLAIEIDDSSGGAHLDDYSKVVRGIRFGS